MTTKEFRDSVVATLQVMGDIAYRAMMGEYCLYYRGILFGGIYDNRLLIKVTPAGDGYDLPQVIPYPGAKPMLFFQDLNDVRLYQLVEDTASYFAARKK